MEVARHTIESGERYREGVKSERDIEKEAKIQIDKTIEDKTQREGEREREKDNEGEG